jgi:tripartite ATP-independent transporter DctM subunit
MESFKESFFALLTPVIIIGGLLSGVFTPTEAAVVAVAYSLILGIYYGNVNFKTIPKFLRETADHTVSVMLIVAGASIFGYILTIEQVPQLITNFFMNNVESSIAAILLINLLLLIVGTFLETIAAITILTPILVPLALSFGFDLTHFGIIMILNLMIGLLTPPLGMVLYVLSSVSKVPFERIVKSSAPYVFVLGLTLLLFTFVPEIVLFLPRLLNM